MSNQYADDHGWRADAACLQYPAEMFYPDPQESAAAARKVCAGCPVAAECIEMALTHRDFYGIHGGLTEKPLRRLAASRRETAA